MYTYKSRKIKRKITKFLLLLIIINVVFILSVMYEKIELYKREEYPQEKPDFTTGELKEKDLELTEIIKNANNSVVGISKIKKMEESIFSEEKLSNLGLGTGIIISENGYILTNAHVSGLKYSTCYITLSSGENLTGDVVWADEDIDLAIIKVLKSGLPKIKLGDSSNLNAGESVYAIGNPIGYEFQRTVTAGIISAVDRVVKLTDNEEEVYMSNLIQTDATINPGNSGGPLINVQGEVVGINSVKIDSAEAIGFAIPINIVKPIIKSFIETGSFEEAELGIFAYDKNILNYFEPNSNYENGIYVEQVKRNSSAEKNGLKKGDIIIQIDDEKINKMSECREYIYTKKIGDKVKIKVLRNNYTKEFEFFLIRK